MLVHKGITVTLFPFAIICLATASSLPEVPVVECFKTSQPPIIDGRLTDASWKHAGRIGRFIWANGIDEPFAPTKAFLLWDEDNLYLALKCYEPRMDKIRISRTNRDSEVWEDDVVEIFIDTDPDTPEYYHIAVNPIGTLFDQITSQKPRKVSEWDSKAQIGTLITSDFWTVEIAIPLSSINAEPKVGGEWRFNLHRKEQRREEYTYWSPTYDRNYSWPHVPERFGVLRLSSRTPEGRKAKRILDIRVEGNRAVPTKEIIDIFGLKAGDAFEAGEIEGGLESLESTGWFEEISADTMEGEGGVRILVEVLEKELVYVDDVRIMGAKGPERLPLFTPDQLACRFGLIPGRMAVEDIDVKCRLIEQLYDHRGYIASVREDLEGSKLLIRIDAGKKPLSKASPPKGPLGLGVRRHLRFGGGGSDTIFNRVRGLILGPEFEVESTQNFGGGRIYGGFSYGFSDRRWDYQFGLESWLFKRHRLIAGIDVHKMTQIRDETLMPDNGEDFIASTIFGENFRDYYQREGYELSLTQVITPSNRIVLRFRDDIHRSLPKRTDWSLFRRDKIKRENLPADEGRMRSLILSYEFDSRNERRFAKRHFHRMPIPSHKTTNGWMGSISLEYAKSPLGAELNEKFDFMLFRFEITRYNRLSRYHFLDFRLKGAIADNALPLQYKFYLGGIGSLRGYRFQEFGGGDRMILANVEYKIAYKVKDGIGIGPIIFIDSGYVWEHDAEPSLRDLKTNIGVGFQIGSSLRINIAKPLEMGGKPMLSMRLRRAF
jgi:hypothetical protein